MRAVTAQEHVIRPSVAVGVAYVAGSLVQSLVVLGALMLAVRGTSAVWPAVCLCAVGACWLAVRSCTVRVVLGGDGLVVRNPLRTYRLKVAELLRGLERGRVGRVPVLAIGYVSMGRWRRLTGGLPLAATGSYSGARRKRHAATINEWLASVGVGPA